MKNRTNRAEFESPRQVAPAKGLRHPFAFWGCGGLTVAIMVWMGLHAFPLCTADEVVFMQAAYMHLHTGQFTSVPTFTGVATIAPCRPGVRPADWSAVRINLRWPDAGDFGFSRWSLLGIDLTVHLLLSGLLAGVVWKVTRNGWLSGLYWMGTTYLISAIGRPEELGLLFAMRPGCNCCVEPDVTRWLLCSLLLGLGGAASRSMWLRSLPRRLSVVRLWLELGLFLPAGSSSWSRHAQRCCFAVSITAVCFSGGTCIPITMKRGSNFKARHATTFREPLRSIVDRCDSQSFRTVIARDFCRPDRGIDGSASSRHTACMSVDRSWPSWLLFVSVCLLLIAAWSASSLH